MPTSLTTCAAHNQRGVISVQRREQQGPLPVHPIMFTYFAQLISYVYILNSILYFKCVCIVRSYLLDITALLELETQAFRYTRNNICKTCMWPMGTLQIPVWLMMCPVWPLLRWCPCKTRWPSITRTTSLWVGINACRPSYLHTRVPCMVHLTKELLSLILAQLSLLHSILAWVPVC